MHFEPAKFESFEIPKTQQEKKQTECDMLINRLETKFVPKLPEAMMTPPSNFEQRMKTLEEENIRLKKEFENALNAIMDAQKKVSEAILEQPILETPLPQEEPEVKLPTNIEPPSNPAPVEPSVPAPMDTPVVTDQPAGIVQEALDIVDRFNKEMVKWTKTYKTNIDIAWDYTDGGKLLKVSSIDANLYKPEANVAKALERFEKGM